MKQHQQHVAMYIPSQPNVYRAVRLEQERQRRREKRARIAEEEELHQQQQQNVLSSSLAASMMFAGGSGGGGGVAGWGGGSVWEDDSDSHSQPSSVSLLTGGGLMDADALVKERVALSAALGVGTAKAILQDEEEARYKERVQQGNDMSSKVGRLLGKLSGLAGGGAAAPPSSSFAAPGSSSSPLGGAEVDPSRPAASSGSPNSDSTTNDASTTNNNNATSKVGHLVFVPSTLAAGGHIMQRVSSSELVKKDKKISGKPSSTIFISLSKADVSSNGDAAVSEEEDQLLGPWVCRALQVESATCGVVRSSRRWSPLDSIAPADDDKSSCAAPAQRSPSTSTVAPPPRLFVRFDSVASAFKAAEKLDGRRFEEFCSANGLALPAATATSSSSVMSLRVAFYPTTLYDSSTFDAPVS